MRDHKTIVPKVEPPVVPQIEPPLMSNAESPMVPRVADRPQSFFRRFGHRVIRTSGIVLAPIGICTVGYLSYCYVCDFWEPVDERKKVLLLPFHRMKLVEKGSVTSRIPSPDEDIQKQVEVSELVSMIHAAAKDPSIVSLYGIFGHDFRFDAGWAQVEEVRDALKIWRESKRTHPDPNVNYSQEVPRPSDDKVKPSCAYADSFACPDILGNKEYALACAFSNIFMQNNGSLNLFGVAIERTFFRSFLEKYGITVHVFKHGRYKNFPNLFTDKGFNRDHRNAVQNLVDQIDRNKRAAIEDRHNPKGLNPMVWKLIRKHGSFTAPQALEIQLIDGISNRCPLDVYLRSASTGQQENAAFFDSATAQISMNEYASILRKRKNREAMKWMIHTILKELFEPIAMFEPTIALLNAPYYNIPKEEYCPNKANRNKIAVLKISGMIDDRTANSVVRSLRKIREDEQIKAIVLRVDSTGGSVSASDRIQNECKSMKQPLVCSMGNSCASGGYYIATACSRIFALPSTITGSIGVFYVKFDLSGLAQKYGINVQQITTGPYSAASSLFAPMNAAVKANNLQKVERFYNYFKKLVSESRGLDLIEVENIAQGRIFTGGEAKDNGLVDELGGLNRAVAFARREYASGEAEVEYWPKRESFFQQLRKALFFIESPSIATTSMSEIAAINLLVQGIQENPGALRGLQPDGICLTSDEESAIAHLLSLNAERLQKPLLHPSIWR